MFQATIALIIIGYFLARLGWQYWHKRVPRGQFIFWLVFWLISAVLILFLRQIDTVAARLGFSSSGIELLLYIAVVMIFYFIFRIRLKLEQMEKSITQLTREQAWKTAQTKK